MIFFDNAKLNNRDIENKNNKTDMVVAMQIFLSQIALKCLQKSLSVHREDINKFKKRNYFASNIH